jgi:integrase
VLAIVTKPPYDLPLSGPAAALFREYMPEGEGWAFQHLGPFDPLKKALDGQLAQVAPWTLHHIRHTVRSLLSKVTTPDIAELCLGHALRCMRRVYDHHLYEAEKRQAMERLAALLHEIVPVSSVMASALLL